MENKDKKGNVFVISGPSGVGKGTILKIFLQNHSEIKLSTSVTTRSPRLGEIDGKDYFFVTKDKFKELIQNNQMLEWAEFAGNFYGTYLSVVKESIEMGKNIALEIDVQGAMQIKDKLSESVLIFIMPPSLEELQSRLINRKTETEESIQKRLSAVRKELELAEKFDYKIVNDNLEDAVNKLEQIVFEEKCKIH